MSGYPTTPSANPYWYYDPHAYQPNVSVSFNPNISGKSFEECCGVPILVLCISEYTTSPIV